MVRNAVAIFTRSAQREYQFLASNRWDFSVMFWLPLATIGLVWWIFSRAYVVDVPIGIVNESHGAASHALVQALEASPELKIQRFYPSLKDSQADILKGDIYAVLVIPEAFDQNVLSAQPNQVILQVNAQYGTHSGIVQKGARATVGTVSAMIEIKTKVKKGASVTQAYTDFSPISMQRISLFNTGTDYQQFLASTVLPALLHILAMIIGATTVGRELRDKTLQQWLDHICQQPDLHSHLERLGLFERVIVIAAGLNGKFIWSMLTYALFGSISLTLAIHTHDASSSAWWTTYAGFLMLMMVSFWLGTIFSLLTMSMREGLSFSALISAPSFAFAGVTFPLLGLPEKAQMWANALPLTHYLKLHIGQLQMGAPIAWNILFGFACSVAVAMLISALLCYRALNNPQRWGAR